MDKKYTSLEHSIRNIMTESISPIGSDEFKGTPKAFLKPAPRIAPKKGDTHPDGTAVLAQRGAAKIGQSKSGGTMSEEEILDEAEFKLPFETGLPSETDEKKKKKEEKEKIKVPTATELTMKDVNTSTVDKLLQKQKEKGKEVPGQQLPYWAKNDPEAWKKYQGELNPYKETPSELFKGKLTKALGDSREAREKVEKLAKIGDVATGGLGGVVMSGADAIELAKQGRTKEALEKSKEFAIGAGTAAVGGAVAGKLASKYAAPSLRGPFAPEAPNPADFDFIPPPKGTGTGAKVRQDFAKADAEATKFKPQAQKYDVTGTRTEAPPKAPEVKPDARVWNPKTGKYYKSKPEADAATKEFDLAAAARKAGGQAQAKTQADVSKPVKVKDAEKFEIAKPAVSKGELVPTEPKVKVSTTAKEPKEFKLPVEPKEVKPSVSTTAKEPKEFKPKVDVAAREPATKVIDKKPIEFKIAEPATNKGSLVVTRPDIPSAKKVSGVEEIPTGQRKVFPGQGKVTTKTTTDKTIDLSASEYKVIPGTDVSTKVKPTTQTQTAALPQTKTTTKTVTGTKTATDTKTVTGTKTATDTAVKTVSPTTSKPPEEKKGDRKRRLPFALKIPGVSDTVLNGLRGFVPAAQYVHYEPQGFMENSEADNIRKTIENVARPGGKTRIAKQGEIKAKIIDENAKRAAVIKQTVKDSTIIKNPKLKHPELDEN